MKPDRPIRGREDMRTVRDTRRGAALLLVLGLLMLLVSIVATLTYSSTQRVVLSRNRADSSPPGRPRMSTRAETSTSASARARAVA